MATTRLSAGSINVKWPLQCKHFKWDPKKLRGPASSVSSARWAQTKSTADTATPRDDCPGHKPPVVDRKPFDITDHLATLGAAGITESKMELKADSEAGREPPGEPTMVKGQPIYPVRHFQWPVRRAARPPPA